MIRILGAGLAGSFLHHHLARQGISTVFLGRGETNTPPVGFVHLFQGRTFHRHPVEVEAYQTAVKFWRAEPLAREWRGKRAVKEGDRVHRSADTDTVPEEFRPAEMAPLSFQYGPGFTVASGALVERMQGETGKPSVGSDAGEDVTVYAVGKAVQELMPSLRWDTNPGRTVEGFCPEEPTLQPSFLHLHKGLHMGGNPSGDGFTLGGRVNSKGEAKDDEAELAGSILQKQVELRSEWWGERIANALDRWPLVGWLDESRFIFAGFGGRALFWLPYCVQVAREALLTRNNAAIPMELRPDRFR